MSEIIRDAAANDWSAIKRFVAAAALPTEDLDDDAYQHFQVWRDDRGIKGVIAVEPCGDRCVMLRSLAVRPDERGHGVGRALVAAAETAARSRACRDIFLLTTSAEAFFSHCGYQPHRRELVPDAVKTHAQFRSLCPASATLMHKSL